jgi:DNA-binding HxlR family transcriptional regulator
VTAVRRRPRRVRVTLNFLAYPLQSSLGVLGRRWALLLLMHIAMGQARRFNELLRRSPGMGRRILAIRLRELEQDGFIARVEQRRGYVLWQLTPKGQDVLPVLLTLIHFASKWRAPETPSTGATLPLARDFEILVHPAVPPSRVGVRK